MSERTTETETEVRGRGKRRRTSKTLASGVIGIKYRKTWRRTNPKKFKFLWVIFLFKGVC